VVEGILKAMDMPMFPKISQLRKTIAYFSFHTQILYLAILRKKSGLNDFAR
jgi:hypothetical protein